MSLSAIARRVPQMGIVAPTTSTLKTTYKGMALTAFARKNPPAAHLTAPKGWNNAKALVISRGADNTQKAMALNGSVWMQRIGVTGVPEYFKLGAAPQF